ncbi:MAG: acyltransferase [Candidatus Nanopelagicales bacterium]
MRLPPAPPVARAVAATPADRDRVLDLIRAAALVVVVLGHGIMGIVGWAAALPVVSNTLARYGWAPWATWLLQIMPLFLVAGGAVNARSWRSGRLTYAPWLWRRVARLLRPVWVYLLIMAPLAGVVSAFTPAGFAGPLLGLATQLLWFVGVYVMACALTPLGVRVHRVHPALGPLGLLAAVALVDWARLGLGLPAALGLLNFLLVWTFCAQLGLAFDDRLLSGWRGLAVASLCVAGNLALIAWGPYPVSMVGLPGEPFSNMAPPSLVLALHAATLTGVVGAARPMLSRVAMGHRLWTGVTAVNLTAMTLYLWHLPVLIGLVSLLHAAGLDRPVVWTDDGQPAPGPGFWLWTVPYLLLFLAGVVGVVRVMWPAEVAKLPGWDRPARRAPREAALAGSRGGAAPEAGATTMAATGATAIGIGALALSGTGLAGFPTRVVHFAGLPLNAAAAIGLMLLGGLLVRSSGSERPDSNK